MISIGKDENIRASGEDDRSCKCHCVSFGARVGEADEFKAGDIKTVGNLKTLNSNVIDTIPHSSI